MAVFYVNGLVAATILVLSCSCLSRDVLAFVVCTRPRVRAVLGQQVDIPVLLSMSSTVDVVSLKDSVSEDSDKPKPVGAVASAIDEAANGEPVVGLSNEDESKPISTEIEPTAISFADEDAEKGSSSEDEPETIANVDQTKVDSLADEVAEEGASDVADMIALEDDKVASASEKDLVSSDREAEPKLDQKESNDLELAAKEETKNYSNKITHLQKKLRYWKRQQKEKETAFKRYLQQQMIDGKTKPVYVREGKIDHYKLRPIYNQETERIQTEVWSIKENIKLTQTKLEAARHVEDLQRETEERLAQAELEKQLQAEEMRRETEERLAQATMVQAQQMEDMQRETEERLEQAELEKRLHLEEMRRATEERLEQARLAQARHAEEVRLLERKAKSLQEESTERLTQKEEEIGSLAEKIDDLSQTLEAKRNELENKETNLQSLEDELQTKESVLSTLERERASLRSLVKQSWTVLKGRFRRRVLGGDDDNNNVGEGEDSK